MFLRQSLLVLVAVVSVAAATFLAAGGVQAGRQASAMEEQLATVRTEAAALPTARADLLREADESRAKAEALEQQRDSLRADNLQREARLAELRQENARAKDDAAARRTGGAGAPAPAPAVAARPGSGTVTLSFDDSATPARVNAILDILAQQRVRAVFCVIGDWAAANPDLIARMQAEGHALCNHTASHAWLTRISEVEVRAEIQGGVQGSLLRPPYGATNATVAAIAAELGYQVFLWNIDTRDWSGVSADSIVSTVAAGLQPGGVILMHLHGPATLDALPAVIKLIRDAGYEIGY